MYLTHLKALVQYFLSVGWSASWPLCDELPDTVQVLGEDLCHLCVGFHLHLRSFDGLNRLRHDGIQFPVVGFLFEVGDLLSACLRAKQGCPVETDDFFGGDSGWTMLEGDASPGNGNHEIWGSPIKRDSFSHVASARARSCVSSLLAFSCSSCEFWSRWSYQWCNITKYGCIHNDTCVGIWDNSGHCLWPYCI